MHKKQFTVAQFICKRKFELLASVFAFDGGGAGDDPKPGEEFDINLIPEDQRDNFEKYKQNLINKGVNIGTARAAERFDKMKGKEVEAFLKEHEITDINEIKEAKALLADKGSIEELKKVYGVETLPEILEAIKAAEEEEMSEVDLLKADYEKVLAKNRDYEKEVLGLKTGVSKKETDLKNERDAILAKLENRIINRSLSTIAKEKGAYDADDIVDRLKKFIRLDEVDGDYVPVVIAADGTKDFDANGDAKTLDSLVEEFLAKRPHLRKSDAKGGAGSQGSGSGAGVGGTGSAVVGKFTKEQLADPKFFQEHFQEIQKELKNGNIKF